MKKELVLWDYEELIPDREDETLEIDGIEQCEFAIQEVQMKRL
jgi:hypothetical protein